MTMTPNRIVLIGQRSRYDEAVADGNIYPGMKLKEKSNGRVVADDEMGSTAPLIIAIEDGFCGKTIKELNYTANNVARFYRPGKGDRFLMLLKNGQNVTEATDLVSAGDGTLTTYTGAKLNQIVAPSTVITNTNTETTFSNGSYAIPAGSLRAGDVIHVRARVFVVGENGTDTHRIRIYLGTAPITLADSAALQLAANDVVTFDLFLTVRTVGATGTVIATGTLQYSISGTFTTKGVTLASTTLDTTVANTLAVKSLASAASTGNQVRLDEFLVEDNRAGGILPAVRSAEAVDNSLGVGTSEFSAAAFIRCNIP